jgi:hypothetical protein
MLAAVAAFALGCDNSDPEGENGNNNPDGGPDGGGPENIDLSQCETYKDNTCAAVIAAGEPERCIADFGYGTCQAGNPGECDDFCGYDKFVGIYAYNDKTDGSVQIPEPNFTGSEPAVEIESCDNNNNFSLHFKASSFLVWGSGVGLDWGGPLSEWSDDSLHPGVLSCLDITQEDPKYKVEEAMTDSRCARPNDPDEDYAMRMCLMTGKNIKQPRDLSDYLGIGFWVLTTEYHEAGQMKVNFPIPATTRFYGNELLEPIFNDTTTPKGCSEEEGIDGLQCFNDYFTMVPFDPADVNKWVYKEVLFDELTWSRDWGMQLDSPDLGLGYEEYQFPTDESIGLKWQIDYSGSDGSKYYGPDFYLDDIILLK